jgi:hypothetical protein
MIKHSNIAPSPCSRGVWSEAKAWAARRPKSAPEPGLTHPMMADIEQLGVSR